MKKNLFALFFFSTILLAQKYVPNQLIIKYRSNISEQEISQAISRNTLPQISLSKTSSTLNAAIKKVTPLFPEHKKNISQLRKTSSIQFSSERICKVELQPTISVEEAITQLRNDPAVEYVQPNYIYKLDDVKNSEPNDSAYSSQWNLRMINMPQYWQQYSFTPKSDVIVGIIDSGIDYLHPDLQGILYINQGEFGNGKENNGIDDDGNGFVDDWRGYNFVGKNGIRDNDIMDSTSHGTIVSGIIGAVTNNGIGISGIAPVKILPLKTFTSTTGSEADIATAVLYAVDNGVEIINMSFGGIIYSALMYDVIRYAYDNNIVMVAASGNNEIFARLKDKPHYPADLNEVISVGAVDSERRRASFSTHGIGLDLVAPGQDVSVILLDSSYGFNSGTSFAAPHVAGVTALLISHYKAQNKSYTNDEIRTVLLNSCQDIGEPGWDEFTGAGILNAAMDYEKLPYNNVTIQSPNADELLKGNTITIIGTATTSQLSVVEISYQAEGENTWHHIAQYSGRHFINETLAEWNVSNLANSLYALRLSVTNIDGKTVENRIRVNINTSTFRIVQVQCNDSTIMEENYGFHLSLLMDRISSGKLFYRKKNSTENFTEIFLQAIQQYITFAFPYDYSFSNTEYEFYCELKDQAGNILRYPTENYSTFHPRQKISPITFKQLSDTLPNGYLLNNVTQFLSHPLMIVGDYVDGTFNSLKAYNYQQGKFSFVDSIPRAWVPIDMKISNGELLTLLGDRGITAVFISKISSGKIFDKIFFADSTTYRGTPDRWASQFYDFDNDGNVDILLRDSDKYMIYKNNGNGSFTKVSDIQNPTDKGNSSYGISKTLIGDFSGTGSTELIFGDSDGDVLMFRQKQTDKFSFDVVWKDTSTFVEIFGKDTTNILNVGNYLTAGDFNGDGRLDFAVVGHTELETNCDCFAPRMDMYIYTRKEGGDANTFSPIWKQSFIAFNEEESRGFGLTSEKILNTPQSQILFFLSPYMYAISYDEMKSTFTPIWVQKANSNSAVVYDFNNNGFAEFGFSDGKKIVFYESSTATQNSPTPWNILATAKNHHTIKLQWSSAQPDSFHNIYRDTIPNPQKLFKTVQGTLFEDTTALTNQKYYYKISLLSGQESPLSDEVNSVAHYPAKLDSVRATSRTQVLLYFSYPIGREQIFSKVSIIINDSIQLSQVIDKTEQILFVTFTKPIPLGTNTIKIRQLVDLYGMLVDTTQQIQFEVTEKIENIFYAQSVKLLSPTQIQIQFNDTVAQSLATNFANYSIYNRAKKFTIENIQYNFTNVILSISSSENLTRLGLRLEISIDEKLQDIQGRKLNNGRAQTLSIGVNVENLDNVIVFPNPFHIQDGQNVSFANIPFHTQIMIFSLNGNKIITLEGKGTEGIEWNGHDENNTPISSGIYFYRITKLDDQGNEQESKMGKFAVVR